MQLAGSDNRQTKFSYSCQGWGPLLGRANHLQSLTKCQATRWTPCRPNHIQLVVRREDASTFLNGEVEAQAGK